MLQSNEPSWASMFRNLAEVLPPDQMNESNLKMIPKMWQLTRLLKGQTQDPIFDLLMEPQDHTILQFVKRVP
jgi:hypothetical protein